MTAVWRERGSRRRAAFRLGAAALAAISLAVGGAAATWAADNDPEPPAGDDDAGRSNACTADQIEGGYEDIGGACLLTGWNWDFGPCHYDVDVGSLGESSDSCTPGGCVTQTCGGGGPGGGGHDGQPGRPDTWDVDLGAIGDLDDFRNHCAAAGGSTDVVDLSTGEEFEWIGYCYKDGFVLGGCLELAELEVECNVTDPPLPCVPGTCEPPNEFPAPEPGAPIVDVGSVALDEAAPAVEGPAATEATEAPAQGSTPEPTIVIDLVPVDLDAAPVAAGFAAPGSSGTTVPPAGPATGLFTLPAEAIDALMSAVVGPLAEPAAAGATGRSELACLDHRGHYVADPVRIVDGALDPLDPEALVFADVDGQRRLVAVAWMTTAPARVLGVPLHLDAELDAFVLHAWLGLDNPAGMLADRHPAVGRCADTSPSTAEPPPAPAGGSAPPPPATPPPTTEPPTAHDSEPTTSSAPATSDPPDALFELSSDRLDFGAVEFGTTAVKFANFVNRTASAVTVDPDADGSLAPYFGSGGTCSGAIEPGATCRLTYSFTSSATGVHEASATVAVTCADCGGGQGSTSRRSVELRGEGLGPVNPGASEPSPPADPPRPTGLPAEAPTEAAGG